ncbi:MAG: SOS response-associated peptidase [Chloroflexota bacterium]|nr:SOS response-associated peptidase [Chloroflexota bacterium]
MCGRYVLAVDPGALQDAFSLTEVPQFSPRFNVAPTQINPVITNEAPDAAAMMRWGLIPSWAKDKKMASALINARAESAAEKPSFRAAFKRRRCLVPVSGYYEWQERESGGGIPTYIHLPDSPLFALAGLWEVWREPETGETVKSYTIITTDANEYMSQFHHRMPVILDRRDYEVWLHDGDATPATSALMRPYSGSMDAYVVSRAVNRPMNDSPDLIEPAAS